MSDLLQGRSAQLDRVLSDLLRQAPEVEAASVVSFDGLPMASALPAAMDENRVAAMSAALLSLGERAAEGLGRGELSQVYVEGESGTVFLVSAEDEAVLVAVGAVAPRSACCSTRSAERPHAVGAALRQDDAGRGAGSTGPGRSRHATEAVAVVEDVPFDEPVERARRTSPSSTRHDPLGLDDRDESPRRRCRRGRAEPSDEPAYAGAAQRTAAHRRTSVPGPRSRREPRPARPARPAAIRAAGPELPHHPGRPIPAALPVPPADDRSQMRS